MEEGEADSPVPSSSQPPGVHPSPVCPGPPLVLHLVETGDLPGCCHLFVQAASAQATSAFAKEQGRERQCQPKQAEAT